MQALESISTIIANICLIGGVIIAVKQLKNLHTNNEIQKEGQVKDHNRRKKQSTIEYYHLISRDTHDLIGAIRTKCSDEIIPCEKIVNDPVLHNLVVRYLNIMERFAVGINIKLYDIDVLCLIGRATTIYNYNLLYDYIDTQRKQLYKSMYCELEFLVETLNRPEYSRPIEEIRKETEIS